MAYKKRQMCPGLLVSDYHSDIAGCSRSRTHLVPKLRKNLCQGSLEVPMMRREGGVAVLLPDGRYRPSDATEFGKAYPSIPQLEHTPSLVGR